MNRSLKRPHTDWRRWAQEWLHVYHSLGSEEYVPDERRSYQKMCAKLRDNMKSRLYYECEEKELCTIQVDRFGSVECVTPSRITRTGSAKFAIFCFASSPRSTRRWPRMFQVGSMEFGES